MRNIAFVLLLTQNFKRGSPLKDRITENLCFIHVKTKPTIALMYKASKNMSVAFTLETEKELKSSNASIIFFVFNFIQKAVELNGFQDIQIPSLFCLFMTQTSCFSVV